MSEQYKAVIRQLFQELDRQNLPALDRLTAPGYVLHMTGTPGPMNIEGAKGLFKMFFAAFPDIRHDVQDVLAEGDKLAARLTVSGTHKGELMGIPATGKSIKIESINMYRMKDGKLAEHWIVVDMMGMMQQLGVIPAPTSA